MGTARRTVPKYLSKKLLMVRTELGLSLEGMVKAVESELIILGHSQIKIYSGNISEFEHNKREPNLPVLLAYARLAKVNLEYLVDDKLELVFK